jgi:hypothetical protein
MTEVDQARNESFRAIRHLKAIEATATIEEALEAYQIAMDAIQVYQMVFQSYRRA